MESVYLLVLVVLSTSGSINSAVLSWHPTEESCLDFVEYYNNGPGLLEGTESKIWGFVCLEERRYV